MVDIKIADDHSFKSLKMNLLSSEGKILSVLISQPACMTKDLPILAGVSTRTAYECINRLCEMGLVTREQSRQDARSKYVKLIPERLCAQICGIYAGLPSADWSQNETERDVAPGL